MYYPGRFIILGHNTIIYGITGRSDGSRARKIVQRNNGLFVEPTNENLVASNRELLIYPCMLFGTGISVSNGKHTQSIFERDYDEKALSLLRTAMSSWSYEPDDPIFTPRISGYLRKKEGALGIISRLPDGSERRKFYSVTAPRFIATYAGTNPPTAFEGDPPLVEVSSSAKEATHRIMDSIPLELRVSVASVINDEVFILNARN